MIKLTKRQTDVYELAMIGLSPTDIAARLNLSVSRVRKHLEQIYQRREVNSRYELMAQEIHALKNTLAAHGIFE